MPIGTEDDDGVSMDEGHSDDDGPDNSFMVVSRLLKNIDAPKLLIKIQSLSQYTDQVLMYKNRV